MLNYLKKFAVEIVPSVAATVIGAYIVNHYINAKPAADTPKAAVMSTAQPKAGAAKPDADKAEAKTNSDTETAGIPASGVKAKGISEKALLEKNAAAEKAVVVEKPAEKPAEKTTDKPIETTASLPAEPKRPAPVRAAKSPAPSVVAAAPADAASAIEDRRDANDLARAAIERLRGSGEAPPRAQAAPRAPEVAHIGEEPRVITAPPPALRPLPPPIVVSAPSEGADAATAVRVDPSRPTPPAEIPTARPPLDLRAEATAEPPKQKTNVAEDMLSAAKSMFHAVIPK
ncbi:MAG TPA: hypothetical protein VJR30_11840 [Bradyrhizobium sp.]|nr:hypothetical protein [Bradyrhizobium sp.]